MLFNKERTDLQKRFPLMNEYLTDFRKKETRKILGRDHEVRSVLANLARKELTNVCLTGEAGVGKTALVQKVSMVDKKRFYFEVDLALMASSGDGVDGKVEMAARLKRLFNEVSDYQSIAQRQVVLFMDEFHIIAETSPAALQAIKPLLAESGRRGFRVIVATTGDEYIQYIQGDEALNQRLQQVKLDAASDEMTVKILENMVRSYVHGTVVPSSLLRQIVKLTDLYLPSQSQPRKSIKVLDAMIGWHDQWNDKYDENLVKLVLHDSLGVNIDHRMDVTKIYDYLTNRVMDQQYAINAVCNRLYMIMSGLTDSSRPLGSFLFSGSTGVGKTEMAKALAHIMYGSDDRMIRFDMSEFSSASSVDSFRYQLTAKIWEHPSSIVLLDEFEKASPEVAKLLLQVLDDAQLSDRHNREVPFKNAMIILTTNTAHEVYKKFNQSHAVNSAKAEERQQKMSVEDRETLENESLQTYQSLIEDSLQSVASFPPELLGRIDAIVPFNPLQRHGRVEITKIQLMKLRDRVKKAQNVTLHFDNRVINLIVDEKTSSDTDAGGGRDVVRQINNMITTPVARFISFNPDYHNIGVNIVGQFKTDSASLLHGTARVKIEPWAGSRNVVTA